MIIIKQDGRTFVDTRTGTVFTVNPLPGQWRVDMYTVDGGSVFILGIYDTEAGALAALEGLRETAEAEAPCWIMPARSGKAAG